MSRCFPFPPPGYEKKSRSGEHRDLLAKEKHKEKRHKKEKKDEEKKDSKERKDKDRSKDKHKEKKDRKEKHKDKKKDKDKSRNSEDQRSEHPTEVPHEVKLGYDIRKSEEIKDSKFTEELGRRIRDKEHGATNRIPEEFTAPSQRRTTESLHSSAAMGKESISSIKVVTPSVQRRVEGMGTAVAMEKQKAASKDMVPNFNSTERKRDESLTPPPVQKRLESMGIPTAVEKQRVASNQNVGDVISIEQRRNHVTGKPVNNSARSVQRGTEGLFHANSVQKERGASNNMAPNTTEVSTKRNDGTSSVQRRNEGMGIVPPREDQKVALQNTICIEQRGHGMGQIEKDTNKKTEGKEKTEEKKAKDGRGEGLKDRDRKEKKRKEKDKDRHKEKEKEKEKKRVKDEVKHAEHDKSRESEKKDPIQMDGLNSKPSAPHQNIVKPPVVDGNNRKRKELEINGFLHEPQPDGRPNKLPRTNASSSNPPVENGTALEFNHISSPISSIIFEVINDTRAERSLDSSEKRHINGKAEVHPPSVSLRPPIAADLSKSGQVSLRPPHPDSKYLNTIYSVPKIEELLEYDDQDWLFSSENPRPKTKLEADVSPPQVWAQGTQIEAADVFALPYVVPF